MVRRLGGRDFLAVSDLDSESLLWLLESASALKAGRAPARVLEGRSVALVFLRPSNRTRVSFEVALQRLGGHPISLFDREIEMGRRESVADVARILDGYVDGLVARIPSHRDLVALAENMSAPVVNAMTDTGHPCQILADLMTLQEARGSIAGAKVTFIGDGNNVCNSWMEAARILGVALTVVTPPGYAPRDGADGVLLTTEVTPAIASADFIYTDVWTSMGQEDQHEDRRHDFGAYQVNEALLGLAPEGARVMHCLPAHRGEEITDQVIDGPKSLVFEQARNRLWVQLALLEAIYSDA